MAAADCLAPSERAARLYSQIYWKSPCSSAWEWKDSWDEIEIEDEGMFVSVAEMDLIVVVVERVVERVMQLSYVRCYKVLG